MNEPVKTLNNYIKQIKLGKESNFDFNKNKNMEISFLRKHNRHNNKKMKWNLTCVNTSIRSNFIILMIYKFINTFISLSLILCYIKLIIFIVN